MKKIYTQRHTLLVANPKSLDFFGFALVGKDIVFRFIIKYGNVREFDPCIIGLFLYEDFWKMIFQLVLKLEIRYSVIISWRILAFF